MDNKVPWLQDDPYRGICRRIQRSLAFATRVSCDEDPDRVELNCGHAIFSNGKNCWHIRHRAIQVTSTSVLGGSLDEYASYSPAHVPANVVASLQYNGNDEGAFLPPNELVPPLELVQWILNAIEFRSMLLQAKASQAAPLCRSREEEHRLIDLSAIFQKIQQEMTPSKGESVSDLLEAAIAYVSSRTSDRNKNWEVSINHNGSSVARSRRRMPDIEAFCQRCLKEKRKEKRRAKRPARSVVDNNLEDAAVSSSNETIQSGSTSAKRISRKRRRQSKSDQEMGKAMQAAVVSLAAQKSTMSTLSGTAKIAVVMMCGEPVVAGTARRPPTATKETTNTLAGEEIKVPVEQGQVETTPELDMHPLVETVESQLLTFTKHALRTTFDNLDSIMAADKRIQSEKRSASVVSLPAISSTTDSERVTPKLGDEQVLSLPKGDDLTDQSDNDTDEFKQMGEQSVSVVCLPTPNSAREPVQPLSASIGVSSGKRSTSVQEQPTISKPKQPTRKHIFIKADQSRALRELENSVHRELSLSIKGAKEITLPGVSESTENEVGSTIMTLNDVCETLEKPLVLPSVKSQPTSTKEPTTSHPTTKAHFNLDASGALYSPLKTEESEDLRNLRRSPIKRLVWDADKGPTANIKRAAESEKKIPIPPKVPRSSKAAKHSLKSPPAASSAQSQEQRVTRNMSAVVSMPAVSTVKKRKGRTKATPSIEKVRKGTTPGRASRKVAPEPLSNGGNEITTRTVAKKRFTEKPLPKRRNSVVDDVEVVGIEEPKQKGETRIGIVRTTSLQNENSGSSIQLDQDAGVGLVSDWVALSHLGLVSDYHGLQRRFDSFFPLKFNKSVVEIRETIEKTLEDAKPEEGENDSNEEAECDLKIANEYEAKASVERAAKRGRLEKLALDIQTDALLQDTVEIDPVERQPIQFVTASQFRDFENDKCDRGDACGFCHPKQEVATYSPPIRHPTFREIDMEAFMLQEPEEEEGEKRGRRRSRTAGLIAQKHLSAAMLGEMCSTLKFIEEYNRGMPKDQPDETVPDTIEEDDQMQPVFRRSFDDSEDQDTNRNIRSLRTRSRSISYDDDDDDGDDGDIDEEEEEVDIDEEEEEESDTSHEANLPQPIALVPEFVKLGHAGLIHDYQALQLKFPRTFLPLSSHDTISSIKASIEQNLGDADAGGSSDEEANAVKKAFLKIVRGYQGKADQEKIEKKVHEEERQLKLREYQYKFGHIKKTQEEVELIKMEKRPLHFVTESQWNQAEKKGCEIGKDCIACGHVEASEVTQVSLLNPRFRMIDLDKLHEVECEHDNKGEKGGRKSRTAELNAQKRSAARALSEIRYTLEFIDTYNEGLIKTKRKKG